MNWLTWLLIVVAAYLSVGLVLFTCIAWTSTDDTMTAKDWAKCAGAVVFGWLGFAFIGGLRW